MMELPGFRDMEEHLSPRARWMKRNNVAACLTEVGSRDYETGGAYMATRGDHKEYGATWDDAINRLAQTLWRKEGIKPWNMK